MTFTFEFVCFDLVHEMKGQQQKQNKHPCFHNRRIEAKALN